MFGRHPRILIAAALLLGACERSGEQNAAAQNPDSEPPAAPAPEPAKEASPDRPVPAVEAKAPAANPCLVQDGERLDAPSLRALGTEPFWAARIEGRCVTYSHPEDQRGTRIWTRYSAGADGGIWSGALGGAPFELRTRSEPGCSDGMSDNVYPIAVDLVVAGERRSGCAEPSSP